jgi:hypothetical protein
MPLDSRLRGKDGLLLCCNRYQEIILDSSAFFSFFRSPRAFAEKTTFAKAKFR